ncbi:unnamed protein product [Rhizophagus irregularis]|nr:unnamed protein product [Rhizophagus irregularis]
MNINYSINLTKSTLEDKNVEFEKLNRDLQSATIELEKYKQSSQKTKGVVDDLNNTLLETNAKLEESINENQHLRNEIQRLEEENRQLNDISAISDTTPMGAVNLALQKKRKIYNSIVL